MITQKEIDRINELYRKSKAEGLTGQEALEQKELREAYVKAFRDNLRGTLETITIQNPDGSTVNVKERHEKHMRAVNENAKQKGN